MSSVTEKYGTNLLNPLATNTNKADYKINELNTAINNFQKNASVTNDAKIIADLSVDVANKLENAKNYISDDVYKNIQNQLISYRSASNQQRINQEIRQNLIEKNKAARESAADRIGSIVKNKMVTDTATALDLLELQQLEQQGVKADSTVVSDVQKHLLGQETSDSIYTQYSSLKPSVEEIESKYNLPKNPKNAEAPLDWVDQLLPNLQEEMESLEYLEKNGGLTEEEKKWYNEVKQQIADFETYKKIKPVYETKKEAKLLSYDISSLSYEDRLIEYENALKSGDELYAGYIDEHKYDGLSYDKLLEIEEQLKEKATPVYDYVDIDEATDALGPLIAEKNKYDELINRGIDLGEQQEYYDDIVRQISEIEKFIEAYNAGEVVDVEAANKELKSFQRDVLYYAKHEHELDTLGDIGDDFIEAIKENQDAKNFKVRFSSHDKIEEIKKEIIDSGIMTKEEVNNLKYYIKSQYQAEKNKSEMEDVFADVSQYNDLQEIGMTLWSVPNTFGGNILSLFDSIYQVTREFFGGEVRPVNPYSDINASAQYAKTIREAVMADQSDTEKFFYGIGCSLLDMGASIAASGGIGDSLTKSITGKAVAGSLTKNATLVSMSLSAGGGSAIDAMEKTSNPYEVAAVGVSAAVFEALAEKLPLDNLFEIAGQGGKITSSMILKAMGSQAASEFGEEAATETANIIMEAVALNDKSDWSQTVQYYIDEGYSESEARGKALVSMIGRVGMSGLAGAISGGVTGGGASTINYLSYNYSLNSTGNTLIKNNQVERLIELAETSGIDISAYNLDGKKGNYNAKAVGELYFELMRNKSDAVSNALKEMGVSEADISIVQSAMLRESAGQPLSSEMQAKYSQYEDVIKHSFEDESSNLSVTANDYLLTSLLVDIARSKAPNNSTGVSETDGADVDFDTNIDGDIDTDVNVESSSDVDATAESKIAEADYLDNETLESVEENEYDKTIRLMDGRAKPLTEAQAYVQSVGRALGYTVIIDDLSRGGRTASGKSFKATTRGFFDGQTIYLHEGHTTFEAIVEIFKHEITHYAELNPKMYEKYANAVFNSKVFENWISGKAKGRSHSARVGQYRQSIIDIYEANGKALDPTGADREIIANFTSEMLFNEKGNTLERFINEVNSEDRNAISQFIHDFISWLKARLKGEKVSYKIIELENRFAAVLRNVDTNAQKNNTTNDGDVQYLFAGQKSRTSNYSLLDQAIKLEDVGKATSEEIRQQTGWFRGYDGKWRYEISDRDIEVDTTGKFHTNPDIRRQTELFNKVYFDATATEAEIKELQVLNKNLKGVVATPKKLGQLIKHTKIFDAYPWLKDVNIRFEFISERGAYNPVFNEIVLSNHIKLNKEQLTKTLIHEIQHAIQYYEAFAGGSNTEYWRDLGIDENELFKYYENTAGEVEARDAANRWWRTDEARKEMRPDIDRADVVFADGNVNSFLSKGNVSDSKKLIETILKNIDIIPKNNLYSISGDGIINGVKSKYILDIFDVQGNVAYREDLGTIELTETGAESTIFHGFGKNKLIAAEGIKNVIEKGVIISKIENYNNKGYNRYVIAGYGTINNLDSIMAVAINEYVTENGRKSFYLHEIMIKNKDASPFMAEQQGAVSAGKASFDNTIPQEVQSVNTHYTQESENNSSPEQNNDGNSYSFEITPEQDAEYLEAVNNGDMETAQRMVDEAAERAMLNSKIRDEDGKLIKVYHGSESDFTVFDKTKGRASMDIQGMFFSPWELDAAGYGSNVRAFYLNIKNPANESTGYKALRQYQKENYAGVKAREHLERIGYDGVNNENEEYIAFNSSQIKSADAITYDDNGNVIPLSERFNEDDNDIRYSFEIAPEQDAEYQRYVESWNKESAQKMVDEKAKNMGAVLDENGNPLKLYRGTMGGQTVFAKETTLNGKIYTIDNIDVASKYGDKSGKATEIAHQIKGEKSTYALYGFPKKTLTIDAQYGVWSDLVIPNELLKYADGRYKATNGEIAEWAELEGYDSLRINNVRDGSFDAGNEIIFFDENLVKSADPITYDDNGNVIPLSQRFNEDNNDIRYSFEDDVVDKTSNLAERVRLGEISQTEYLNELQRLMNEATEKYGAIPKGENPKVDVTVPKQVSDKRNTRRFVRTVLESGTLTDEMVADTDEAILKDALSYVPISNEEAIKVAANSLKNGTAERDWNKIANGDKIPSKHDIAKGEILLKMYAENGDTLKVMELVADLSEVATRAGQTVQAFSLLKKMSGVGQLYYVQKTVDKLNRDLEKKHKDKHEQITIDETLAGQLVTAKPGTETENIVDEIMQDIAEQVPVTFLDKWNAWRYLAMLGNPRTHIRNLLGNAVFMPAIKLKDTIKTGMEKVFVSQENRTTSVIVNKEYKDFAKSDFEKVVDIITGNGKMNPSDTIREKQKIFKNKVLEGFRKFNFDALEKEDMIFLKMHYTRALGGFLQARNVDLNNVDEVTLNEARNYAIEEAQKATYRDMSALANTVSRFSRSNKVANLLVEGILPFKKTPINIVKRGIEYSPVGLLKTLSKGSYDLAKGNITASQFIDGISSGLTGTGVFVLGVILSNLGIAIGGLGYDDDDALKRLNGEQGYSIELFGKSYTVDWMAPVCIPFFMGVEFANTFADNEKDIVTAFVDAAYSSLEPVINLSMLSGIRDTIAAARYSDAEDVLTQVGGETISSYFSQALPTLFGQVARTFDDTRRSNYVSGDATGFEKKLYEFFQNAMGKTPILENQKMPYTDAFGEKDTNDNFFFRLFENMLSPGYSSTIKETDVNAELADLFGQTGDSAVIPQKAPKSFNVNGERIYLNADEYTQYNTKKGQLSQNMLVDLFNSKGYKSMTYTKKAEAVSEVYKYANMLAKTEVSDYQLEGKYAKWQEYQGYGYDVSELIALKIADKDLDGSGGVSKSEYAEAVNNTDMNQKQKDLLIGLNDVEGKSDYSKSKTKGFGAGDWYYKKNGQYIKITSAAELNQLRRNNVDTYVYTGNYTDEIDELWKAYRGY